MQPTLGFVGAGKVAGALARLWVQAGYAVQTVNSRSPARAAALAEAVGARAVERPEAVIEAADLTLLTVPDDTITPLAESLGMSPLAGKGVVHTSGARDAGALAPLAARGAWVGSLHPAYPFVDVDGAVAGLPGATFAVEAESPLLREWLFGLARAVHGQVLIVPPGGKVLYHAALAIASNYAVTLYAVAERLLVGIGAEREAADGALNTLLRGTLDNLREQGIPAALPGPLTRADVGTVRAHLRALAEVDPSVAAVYIQLARLSLPMLAARGVPTQVIEQILQEAQDASHHP